MHVLHRILHRVVFQQAVSTPSARLSLFLLKACRICVEPVATAACPSISIRFIAGFSLGFAGSGGGIFSDCFR